jgi:hypothetical protein
MTQPFIIAVSFNGEEKEFTAQYLPMGYSHKFKVTVGATEVFFEPDEDGSYRAAMMPGQDQKEMEKINRGLLQLLAEKIQEILS